MMIEAETKTREERRLENQRKEGEIAKVQVALTSSISEFEAAKVDLEAKIEQEVQRNAKHKQIVGNLRQALDEVKSSKAQVEAKLAEVEAQIEATKGEAYVLETRKREIDSEIVERRDEMKNSLPLYQLKTLICRSCKKYLRQNTTSPVFKYVSEDNLRSFIGTLTTLPTIPAAASSTAQCNCSLM
jgi:DNA repair exonuclease SbcCD ATPase subunit